MADVRDDYSLLVKPENISSFAAFKRLLQRTNMPRFMTCSHVQFWTFGIGYPVDVFLCVFFSFTCDVVVFSNVHAMQLCHFSPTSRPDLQGPEVRAQA